MSFAHLAIPQYVHRLEGLALPYWTKISELGDRPTKEPPSSFQPGCLAHCIARQQIELVMDGTRYEFLCNQRGGLDIHQRPSGVYFKAHLPDTRFTRALMRAADAGGIVGVCPRGTIGQEEFDGELQMWRIQSFDCLTFSLELKDSRPHIPETFVTTDRAVFDRRVAERERHVDEWMSKRLQPA